MLKNKSEKMIKSMTGFSRCSLSLPEKKVTVEIKSLNSKQMDLSTRIPSYYREKEIEVRKYLTDKLVRGKVDMALFVEMESGENSSVINVPVVESYLDQLEKIVGESTPAQRLEIAMRLPDSLKTERGELDQEEWRQVFGLIVQAVERIDTFRSDEGRVLEKELEGYVENIRALLGRVDAYEKERIASVRERLTRALADLGEKADPNRFEQELIFYLEKLDITEEKVRLTSHLNYFLSTMGKGGESGKKLGFIAQEMGREINTMGSKANHAELQKIVVRMKDELEKIKEQSLNVL